MLRTFPLSFAAAAAFGLAPLALPQNLLAQNSVPVPAAASDAVAPEALEKWARDLDSDNFDARQEATRRLVAAGKQAIPAAVKAAQGDSLEVTSRAVEVLKKLSQSTDKPTQAAAKEALEGLAKSDNKTVARRAAAALQPEVDPNQAAQQDQVIQAFGGIQIAGARVVKMQAQNNNGLKSIEVEEDGKKIKLTEDNAGIVITVTEKVDGKEKVSSYKAKDVEELKKNHPEGHKIYEKYNKQVAGGAIQIQVQAGNAFPVPLPIQIQAQGLRQRLKNQEEVLKGVAQAQKDLEAAAKELEKAANNGGLTPEAVKKLAEQIDTAAKRLAEVQKQFGE